MNKQDQQNQDEYLGEHSAGKRLKKLVGDAKGEGGNQRAPEVAHTAEYHHHEAVDDVILPEIGRDIVDLAQCNPGNASDARAKPECQRIGGAGADAHGGGHPAILGNGPHVETKAGGV